MENKDRVRKAWKRGEVTQKLMAFRLDLENIEYLNTKANKGRYINELIAREREKSNTK